MTPTRVTAPFGRRAATVKSIERHGPYVSLRVIDADGPCPSAGQFYMLQTAERWGGGDGRRPYLPRAISFARVERVDDRLVLSFLLEPVGPGTERLAACVVDEHLLIAGPFGNGFDLDEERRSLLVAGGVGLSPIIALDDQIQQLDGMRSAAFVGMRDAERARAVEFYGLRCELATEDGSSGHEGFVTDLLANELGEDREAAVYACGPPAMLEAVRALCAEREVPCQLALESAMACGYGACHGCVVPTIDGYVRLCIDGPVLLGDRLETVSAAGTTH